jgi:hypothetical protein
MDMKDTHPLDLLEAALEGGLDAAGTRRLKAHLAGCPACAQDLKFARREREVLAGRSGGLTLREMGEIETHAREHIFPSRVAVRKSNPWPVRALSAAAAAALVVWFGVRREYFSFALYGSDRKQAAMAFGIRASTGGEDFLKGRDLALARIGLIPRAGSRATAIAVNGFESVADLTQVTVSGYAQPDLVAASHSGERALRLARAGTAGEPAVLAITVPSRRNWIAAEAVSVWIRAVGTPVEVALLTGAGSAVRRVEPGPWTWVLLQVPPGGNVELEKRGIMLGLTGDGAVLLDGVELWCAPATPVSVVPAATAAGRKGG